MKKEPRAITALYEMYKNKTGDKLKEVENMFQHSVEPSKPFVIRLDGVAFHTFLKGVVKPFDSRITDAMVKTTADLVTKFQALTGYTSSDEISLVFKQSSTKRKFNGNEEHEPHMYQGRVQKLASVTSGYASARFNYHLSHPMDQWDDLPAIKEKMQSGNGFFDGRVCSFDNLETLMECIYWRSNFDAFRNAVTQIASSKFSHKELHGKSVTEMISILGKVGVNVLEDIHPRYLFGTWIKKKIVELVMQHPKTNQEVLVSRGKVFCGSFNWSEWSSEDRTNFLMEKYWMDNTSCPPIDLDTSKRLFRS